MGDAFTQSWNPVSFTICVKSGCSCDSFCAKYLDHIPGMTIDEVGNRVIAVGSLTKHPVMWSSHTDTVHRTAGTQKVLYGGGLLSLHEKSPSSCLGADCTVGVWLMINMNRRNVPGLYIFQKYLLFSVISNAIRKYWIKLKNLNLVDTTLTKFVLWKIQSLISKE